MRASHGVRGAVALALALVPALARAQDGSPGDTAVVGLPEVVVTALRGEDRLREIPATAFVISRSDLAGSATPRLSAMLQWLPGLYGYQSGASGEPTVVDPRGFTANGESSYLKVLVNGRETRDLENGNVDWDWIGSESVERVEVVEGVGAWVYGDGAEGGIVNIVRAERRAGFGARATLRGGSYEQRGGSLGLSWGASPWSVSLGGGGRDVDGWRDRSRERARNANALASWRPSGVTAVSLDASWLATDRQDPGTLTPDQMAADRTQAENPEDFVASDRATIALGVSHGDPERGQWTLAPYARIEDFEQIRTLAFTPMLHPTTGTTLGTDLGWRTSLGLGERALKLRVGYGLERAELRSRYYDGPPGARRSALVGHGEARRLTQAAFASAQLDLMPGLSARAGLRVDAIRVEFDDLLADTSQGPRTLSAASPFVALSARSGGGMVYASVTGGFRAPTLNQLYDRRPFLLPFPPFVLTISNGDLQPQRSWSYEIGGRWDAASGHAASLSYYDLYVKDEIDFDAATFSYANLAKSRHAGVVASAWSPLGRFFTLFAAATLSPTTVRGGANDGNQINAVPIGSALGRLEWGPAAWATADAGVRWVGRQYLDKENDHPLGEYASVEAGASLRYGRGRLSLRMTNLLDRDYADTGFIGVVGEERLAPAAGRSVTAALTLE